MVGDEMRGDRGCARVYGGGKRRREEGTSQGNGALRLDIRRTKTERTPFASFPRPPSFPFDPFCCFAIHPLPPYVSSPCILILPIIPTSQFGQPFGSGYLAAPVERAKGNQNKQGKEESVGGGLAEGGRERDSRLLSIGLSFRAQAFNWHSPMERKGENLRRSSSPHPSGYAAALSTKGWTARDLSYAMEKFETAIARTPLRSNPLATVWFSLRI